MTNIVEESRKTGRPIIEVATGKEVTEYFVYKGSGELFIAFKSTRDDNFDACPIDGHRLALKPATATIWYAVEGGQLKSMSRSDQSEHWRRCGWSVHSITIPLGE